MEENMTLVNKIKVEPESSSEEVDEVESTSEKGENEVSTTSKSVGEKYENDMENSSEDESFEEESSVQSEKLVRTGGITEQEIMDLEVERIEFAKKEDQLRWQKQFFEALDSDKKITQRKFKSLDRSNFVSMSEFELKLINASEDEQRQFTFFQREYHKRIVERREHFERQAELRRNDSNDVILPIDLISCLADPDSLQMEQSASLGGKDSVKVENKLGRAEEMQYEAKSCPLDTEKKKYHNVHK